jgi:hypothetical protein
MAYDGPHGFVLSDAAIYAFSDQDVFPDVLSFSAAIPDHLKPLFLIPIRLETITASNKAAPKLVSKIADDSCPTGDTEEADLFGTKTFVYDDNSPTVPSSEPGSIFQMDDADDMTHHQEFPNDQDINIQVPSETSYMSDVDLGDSNMSYPYRDNQQPRHSSIIIASLSSFRLALKSDQLERKTPRKIKDNAKTCTVNLVSYDERGRVFTFEVNCGNGAKTVRAAITDADHVALSCTCPFWRYNGPEFHADTNSYLLGAPRGTVAPPDIRDPDRQYFLCKHAYAVLRRLDEFVSEVVDESWGLDEPEVMEKLDKNWDKMSEVAEVPIEDFDEGPSVEWEELSGEEAEEVEDLSDEEIIPEDDESEEISDEDIEYDDEDEIKDELDEELDAELDKELDADLEDEEEDLGDLDENIEYDEEDDDTYEVPESEIEYPLEKDKKK